MSKIPISAAKRLKRDLLQFKSNPIPSIEADPLPSNILEWHYVFIGPERTPYHGGYYHGMLSFPTEYPFKAPAIYMFTPNGRFKTNQRICLSVSDFHSDTWNPAWTVSTILTGLLSFMLEPTATMGSIETSDLTKIQYAKSSLAFNLKNKVYVELFSNLSYNENNEICLNRENDIGNEISHHNDKTNEIFFKNQSISSSLIIIICIFIFSLIVHYIIRNLNLKE